MLATTALNADTLDVPLPLIIVVAALVGASLIAALMLWRRRREIRTVAELVSTPLVVNDVVKTYGDGFRAVDGVSFRAEPGQVVGVLGPNGAGKTTVIRMLDEALKRGEVQIWIDEGVGDCVELATRLERAYGLDEAIVVPAAETAEGTAKGVGLALGQFLTEVIPDDCTVGVGWGRTLTASLASFRPARRERVKVVSLLGGVVEAHHINPIEYSWRIASQLGAECYLFLAPLIVDSAETKRSLIEKCGLKPLFELAENMDIAVVSCGDIGSDSTSLSRGFLPPAVLKELVAAGCVCDTMCNFLDAEGRTIDHPIRDRVMSIDLDTVKPIDKVTETKKK